MRDEISRGNLRKTLANGWTALHSALLGGNYEAAEMLLAAGADVNRPAHDGWTLLHAAVANAHSAWRQAESQSLDRIRELVGAGSGVEARDLQEAEKRKKD